MNSFHRNNCKIRNRQVYKLFLNNKVINQQYKNSKIKLGDADERDIWGPKKDGV